MSIKLSIRFIVINFNIFSILPQGAIKILLHYCHRFHQAWSAYYYGSPGEREAHNGAIRETLKQQIDDRDTARVYDFHTRISESIEVGERDRADVESDSARVAEHKRRLLEYSDANKRVRFYFIF